MRKLYRKEIDKFVFEFIMYRKLLALYNFYITSEVDEASLHKA